MDRICKELLSSNIAIAFDLHISPGGVESLLRLRGGISERANHISGFCSR